MPTHLWLLGGLYRTCASSLKSGFDSMLSLFFFWRLPWLSLSPAALERVTRPPEVWEDCAHTFGQTSTDLVGSITSAHFICLASIRILQVSLRANMHLYFEIPVDFVRPLLQLAHRQTSGVFGALDGSSLTRRGNGYKDKLERREISPHFELIRTRKSFSINVERQLRLGVPILKDP